MEIDLFAETIPTGLYHLAFQSFVLKNNQANLTGITIIEPENKLLS